MFATANNKIVFVAPALTYEISEALIDQAARGVQVHVALELNEDIYRRGEGEFKAFENLTSLESIDLRVIDGVNISFFMIDNQGYAYYPPNRPYEQEGSRYNIFELHYLTTLRLINSFWPANSNDEFSEQIQSSINQEGMENDDQHQKLMEDIAIDHGLEAKPVDENKYEETKKSLSENPPLELDLKRVINTYNSYFQFVEINFKGSKLQNKLIKLPNNALPIKNERLKDTIQSQLKLFNNDNSKSLYPLSKVNDRLDEIRDKYTRNIKTRGKRIIRTVDKHSLIEELNDVKEKAKNLEYEIVNELQRDIQESEESIYETLREFYRNNPPEELNQLSGDVLERQIDRQVSSIVSKINFPLAKDLISEISLKWYFYDITWEDLNNEDFRQELVEAGLIDNKDLQKITNVSTAVATKKNEIGKVP